MKLAFASRPLEPVRPSPFPHVLVDNWLDAGLYVRLRASFPSCPANIVPTGFTLLWGYPADDRLIAALSPRMRRRARPH
jgi:hypothetical protein